MTLPSQPEQDAAAPCASEGSDKGDRRRAFGAMLKGAREARGLSIAGLSQLTRITHAFLEAIEAGAFEKLPGAVFGRGFVRSIARATGLDDQALVREFETLWEREAPTSVLKVEIRNRPTIGRLESAKNTFLAASRLARRGMVAKALIPVIGVAVLGVVSWRSTTLRSFVKVRIIPSLQALNGGAASVAVPVRTLDFSAKPADAVPEVASSTEAKTADPAVAAAAETGAPSVVDAKASASVEAHAPQVAALSSEQALELTVTSPVRIRVEVDGGETVTKELAPDTYRFNFKSRADLMVYDAAAVKVSFNGRSLGSLGAKGRVRRLSFEAGSATPNEL